MQEFMYNFDSSIIVAILCICLLVAVDIGFRIGARSAARSTDSTRAQINTIQASLLGVLALLLGFTFSLALQRYDTRSQAVVDEANAIGTAILRAGLLPASVRVESRSLLLRYLDARIAAGAISLDRKDDRQRVLDDSARLFDSIWQLGLRAAEEEPNPVSTGLYVQALNTLIDSYGVRDSALDRHVPEVVLLLLFGTFTLTACLVGYTSGLSGHRASFPTYVLIVLIVFLVFIIVDLDRPRRGLIEVSQQSLHDLRTTLYREAANEN